MAQMLIQLKDSDNIAIITNSFDIMQMFSEILLLKCGTFSGHPEKVLFVRYKIKHRVAASGSKDDVIYIFTPNLFNLSESVDTHKFDMVYGFLEPKEEIQAITPLEFVQYFHVLNSKRISIYCPNVKFGHLVGGFRTSEWHDRQKRHYTLSLIAFFSLLGCNVDSVIEKLECDPFERNTDYDIVQDLIYRFGQCAEVKQLRYPPNINTGYSGGNLSGTLILYETFAISKYLIWASGLRIVPLAIKPMLLKLGASYDKARRLASIKSNMAGVDNEHI